jgi:ATP-binding cassette subfamily B protein
MITALLLSLSGPYLFHVLLDIIIPNKKGVYMVLLIAFLYIATQLASAFLTKYRIKRMGIAGQSMIKDIRSDMFKKLQELPFTYYDDRPHGKILVRVVNYVNTLSDLLSGGIINLLVDLLSLVFIAGFMFNIEPRLALISLLPLPVLLAFLFFINGKMRRNNQKLSAKSSNLNAYVHESIAGMKVTQAFTRETFNMGIFDKLGLDYKKSWYRSVFTFFTLNPVVEMISVLSTCLLYFCSVKIPYFAAGLQVGVIVAFGAYIGRFWGPIQNMTNVYNQVINAMAYLERIFETIDEPVLVTDAEDAVEMSLIDGNVEFEDVTFGYDENRMILNDVNFKVKSGSSIALVGATGAGKTTIVNLLSRFYNLNGGRILVDDTDISKVTLNSLRKQMGIMLQDPFLFSGTIIDNIRYSRLNATDEEVVEAAKAVMADGFISQMPEGYYTLVNERGSNISQGQRQLISFARAILADPRILVLDEATASIDTKTEILVQEGLDRLLEGRTSFIIAHRLSTIRNSDCIMYVDKGGIQESGTHDELMKLRGNYYNLYMSQYLNMCS